MKPHVLRRTILVLLFLVSLAAATYMNVACHRLSAMLVEPGASISLAGAAVDGETLVETGIYILFAVVWMGMMVLLIQWLRRRGLDIRNW